MEKKEESAIEIAENKFRGLVYPYLGSGMLTNTEDENVINLNVKNCVNVMLEYCSSETAKKERLKLVGEQLQKEIESIRNAEKSMINMIAELQKKLLVAKDIIENVKLHFESELHDMHMGEWRDSEETILEKSINFLTVKPVDSGSEQN